MLRFTGIMFAIFALGTGVSAAETFRTELATIEVEVVADRLDHPWGMAELPDGGVLVTERRGKLWYLSAEGRHEVANVPNVAAVGQGGLLDITADENFAENRRIYFTWSEPGDGGYATALSTAVLSTDNRSLGEVRKLFAMDRQTGSRKHFGSRVVLAPNDMLYMTMGDRGQADRAQDLTDHAGSVIRINRDGTVPDDNPYIGRSGAMPELWSKGHRNPQGAAMHPETGQLWTVEHGARGGDEINRPQAGKNYGWPVISYGRHYSGTKIGEGTAAPGYEQPEWYWDPSIAPSGLAFYDGELFPQWRGDMLVGALKFELLARLDMEDGRVVREERILEQAYGRIRDVDVFSDGAVYLLTDESNGQLLRITPAD